MATSSRQRFANYPKPIEAQNIQYEWDDDKNPALRGLPLVVGAAMVSRSSFLARLLFENAGFGSIKYIPNLHTRNWRFNPTVIPIPSNEDNDVLYLPFGPDLEVPRQDSLPGKYLSAADYHSMYKSGELSPVDVIQVLAQYTNRDAAKDNEDYQTAWAYSGIEAALAQAKDSESRYREGKSLGVLDGVPFGVKDEIYVKGFPACFGFKPQQGVKFFDPVDETIGAVRRLETAGAICIGKLVQHELGSDTSGCNPYWGTAINWHNPSYYSGGSSSGCASAACAGVVPITVGSDAGGSIRIPAAFSGIYGLKPTHERMHPQNSTVCVVGPICGTAADLVMSYRIMAQPDFGSPFQSHFAVSRTPPEGSKKYLGLCRPWLARAEPAVLERCEKVIEFFVARFGYEVVEIDLPFLREGQLAHGGVALTEMADQMHHSASNPAAVLALANTPNKVLLSVGRQANAGDYLKWGQVREVLMQHLAFLFQKYPGISIISPTSPIHGWKRNKGDDDYGFSDGNMSIKNMTYVWLANMTGCPAVSFPVGYVDPNDGSESGNDGRLPIGLMAMGEWGSEETLLQIAMQSEEYLYFEYPGGRVRPKGWIDVIEIAKNGEKDAKNSEDNSSR